LRGHRTAWRITAYHYSAREPFCEDESMSESATAGNDSASPEKKTVTNAIIRAILKARVCDCPLG
jgi:hypothetical protein